MAEVILAGLTKRYEAAAGGRAPAVNGVDLAIAHREFLVLVGPSGCGKSTILRMIAGLEDISAGEIRIGGRRVNDVAPKDRDIAMVFQNYALYPHLSVYDNLAFGLKLRRVPRPEIDRRVRDAAAWLGLTDHLTRQPKALSGGQRQRVAVGRAMVRQPQVFLFDEPLSNLDAQLRVTTRAEILRLHRQLDATMIYVTHDQMEAMTMGDRICVLHGGAVQQVAPPLEVYHHPANRFVAGFIGSPPMNFFPGWLSTECGRLQFRESGPVANPGSPGPAQSPPAAAGFTLPLPETSGLLPAEPPRPVLLGIRPENLHVAAGGPVPARVELVESLGAETFLHLATAAHRCIARLPPGPVPSPGSEVRLHFSAGHLHFFDPESGRTLTPAASAPPGRGLI